MRRLRRYTLRANTLIPPQLTDAHSEKKATWLELFFDLIFVVAINQAATQLAENYTAKGWIATLLLLLPIWWAWVGHTFYLTRFDTNDLVHQIVTGAQMFLVACMAVAIPSAIEGNSGYFVIAYIGIRSLLVWEYLRAGLHIPRARPLTTRYALGFGIAASIWGLSLLLPEQYRWILWLLAIAIDYATPLTAGQYNILIPPHFHHVPERLGLFTIIVLGESVAGLVIGLQGTPFHWVSLATAMGGFTLAFGIWWAYFMGVRGAEARPVVDAAGVRRFRTWLYLHLPLTVGIVTVAMGVKKAILVQPGLPFPAEYAAILVLGNLVVLECVRRIFITSPEIECTPEVRRTLRRHGTVNVIGILVSAVAAMFVPATILIFLCAAPWIGHMVLGLQADSEENIEEEKPEPSLFRGAKD